MSTRYTTSRILDNDSEFYDFLRKKRGAPKSISHMSTVIMRHPTMLERAAIKKTSHIWKYGDRFYNLAHKYYDNAEYWWVIAWYNGVPTEADINNGDAIVIPLDIESVLVTFGVY